MLSETHTVSANKVNEFRFGRVYTHIQQDIVAPRMFDEYGIKGALNDAEDQGPASVQHQPPGRSGHRRTRATRPFPPPAAATSPARNPARSTSCWTTFPGSTTATRSSSAWTSTASPCSCTPPTPRGPIIAFNGTYTGIGLGDFLLGYVQNTNINLNQQLNTIQQYVYHGYVQDDWKATTKLTINAGLRYEVTTPFTEARDKQSNFVIDPGPCYLQLIQVADRAKCGVGRALTRTDFNNFAPRVGLAYQATPKTVIRSGFGVFYGRDEDVGVNRRLGTIRPGSTPPRLPATRTTLRIC